jgi:hypothetical protein
MPIRDSKPPIEDEIESFGDVVVTHHFAEAHSIVRPAAGTMSMPTARASNRSCLSTATRRVGTPGVRTLKRSVGAIAALPPTLRVTATAKSAPVIGAGKTALKRCSRTSILSGFRSSTSSLTIVDAFSPNILRVIVLSASRAICRCSRLLHLAF